MKKRHPKALYPLLILLLAFVFTGGGWRLHAAPASPAEPLPVTVFKNLAAGKKQTVLVYGTSLTAVSEWPKALQSYFDQQFPGLVTFVNAAKSGETSVWGVANLQKQVLSKTPDLVFLEFSVNDANAKHKITTEKSEANLDVMVKALRAQNPQVDLVLQTMNTAWDSPNEPSHKKYASDRPQLAGYYDVYRTYAHENGLPLVDNYPLWLKLQQQDEAKFEKWLPEGLHPIPEASLAITWPDIKALLEKARTAAKGN
ncbi:MAG: SGNH/GDSL hydrolase family protein [Chthoniobacteraceae bacterium]